jgi:flagellar M-ring protein FliF
MNQITAVFQKLTMAQRIWLAAVALAVVGGITALSHWNQERDFKPLFTAVAAEDAGPLLAKLREAGTEYRLADSGTTVLVPSARVAELRIEMASAGLPKSGRIGFELFDKNNFGASEFAEQVNYHRAIEGELERSIMSIREVEQARVHITLAKESLYTESRQPAKASILLKLRHAAALSPQNIAAVCQLTANAVPGLAPEQVSLVDTNGNLLNRARTPSAEGDATEATLDYRKSIEHDLQNKIAATLDPLLGPGHFRAGVSAEVDLTSGEQSEETYDPQKSVMASSQTTEDGQILPAASGVPGTASALPRPTSKPSTGASNYSRRTENINYQTSRIVKHTRVPQGSVKRLSLSVLVDHTVRWENGKRVIEAPPAEKLKVIHDVVAAAAGVDTNRGDQLVVEAFPFESTLSAEPEPGLTPAPGSPAPAAQPQTTPLWMQKRVRIGAGIGAGVLIAAVAGIFFLRRKTRGAKLQATAQTALPPGGVPTAEHSAEDTRKRLEGQIAQRQAESARQEVEALMSLKMPVVKTKKTEVLIKHIGAETKNDPGVMARVVRTWLNG